MTFKDLGLAEPILRALEAEGYATPTPIQSQAIPILLKGKDLLGVARQVLVKQLLLVFQFYIIYSLLKISSKAKKE